MLRRFFTYYAPYRGLFALDFTSAVVAGVLELAFPLAVQLFIDRLLPTGHWVSIAFAAGALALVYLLNTGLMATVTYWGHMLGINIETDMRRKAFDHLQKLSFGYYDEQKTGHLVARLTKDLEEIGEVAHHGPEDLFIAIMTLIGAFVLMFTVSVPLALITLVVVPFTGWFTVRYGGRMTQNWRAIYDRVGAFNSRIEENVGGIRVVQAFANEDHERALFSHDNQAYRTTKLEAYRIMAATNAFSYLSMRFTQLIVMVAGSYFVVNGSLSNGGFVAFILLVGVFFRPLEKINAVIETYPKGIAGFKRYTELIDTRPDIVDRPGAADVASLRGDIRYEGVSFSYAKGKTVLAEIDLSIAAGETVAFVGPSGAGKSTVAALIPRFQDATSGAVCFAGTDVKALKQESLLAHIGIVSQETYLFHDTIAANLRYAKPDATQAELEAAARAASIHDVIVSFPAGYETIVGERGHRLSGGEKQRIAIARIFLKDPAVLILDEATSALDTLVEAQVQDALDAASHGRTTIAIAHRLSTIRNADRIYVLDGGRIVERGTHGELIDRAGQYAALYLRS